MSAMRRRAPTSSVPSSRHTCRGDSATTTSCGGNDEEHRMTSAEQTKSRIIGLGGGHGGPVEPGSAYLLVLENDSSTICHLPRSGAIVIGRGEVELRLTHASVSRRHAT